MPLLGYFLNHVQSCELSAARDRVRELQGRLQELEDSFQAAQKDLIKSQDLNARLQRDLKVSSNVGSWDESYNEMHRLNNPKHDTQAKQCKCTIDTTNELLVWFLCESSPYSKGLWMMYRCNLWFDK